MDRDLDAIVAVGRHRGGRRSDPSQVKVGLEDLKMLNQALKSANESQKRLTGQLEWAMV